MMRMIRSALVWIAFDVRLGRLNPSILRLAIGRMARKGPGERPRD
jgi:hypothetical protein